MGRNQRRLLAGGGASATTMALMLMSAWLPNASAAFIHNAREQFQCTSGHSIFDAKIVSQQKTHKSLGKLHAGSGDLFNDIQNFFDDFKNSFTKKDSVDPQEDDAEAGAFEVVTIPVESMKTGGLRLFMMFYLMGMQNTPDSNSWKADQPLKNTSENYNIDSNDEGAQPEEVLDFYYHDRTAMLSIVLSESQITIKRIGSTPSTSYLMHETLIIEGILNELHQCAFDESIAMENRLLQLPPPGDAIEKARDILSFA